MTTAEVTSMQKIASLHRASEVPLRYAKATLAGGGGLYRRVAERIEAIVKEKKDSAILILGGADTYRNGKTYLGCGGVNLSCELSRPAIYTSAAKIFRAFKCGFGSKDCPNAIKVYESLMHPDVVVIDECQVKADSEFELAQFRELIDDRHANLKSTILNFNLPQDMLDEYLGPALVLRANESKGGGFIECVWEKFWNRKA